MIHKAIYTILSNSIPVTDLVTDKIYPIQFNQEKSWPGIVYQITGGQGKPSKNETSIMDSWTLQIDVYADKPIDTNSISAAVRGALENYEGTVAGEVVSNIEWLTSYDGFAEDPNLFRLTTKYLVTIKK